MKRTIFGFIQNVIFVLQAFGAAHEESAQEGQTQVRSQYDCPLSTVIKLETIPLRFCPSFFYNIKKYMQVKNACYRS